MKPVMSYYYVTIRCNSRCKYCNFWKREATEEPTINQLEENIKSLRKLGVKYIDFTGGEPFLYPHLQEALRIAKKNRLITAVTSNGISYQPVDGLDYLLFSLDYPDNRHDKVRGVQCFSRVINSIERAKEAGQNVRICWTVTHENIDEIDNMIDLCKRYDIMLGVNYSYSYFGNKSIDYEHARKLKSYFRHPNVLSDYAALSFIQHGGNNPYKRQ